MRYGTIIMHPKNKEQLDALKSIAKVLKVQFETTRSTPYNPDFVEKVLQGRKEIKADKGTKVDIDNLWK